MKIRFAIIIGIVAVFSGNAQSRRTATGINALDQQHAMQGSTKPPTPEEQLDKTMSMMTSELVLNGLQEAAVRNILHDQQRKMTALKSDTRPDSEKKDEAVAISEKSDKDIKALLDADQLKKYDALKEQLRSGKKIKKKDRKKKSDEQEEQSSPNP